MRNLFFVFLLFGGVQYMAAQIVHRETPQEWEQLVMGARFKDRFLPMPKGTLSDKSWGDACVQPRYVDNGIEDDTTSYWGGNIVKGEDEKYHLFVCGWSEKSEKGHWAWPYSVVYHAVSNQPHGPFLVKDTIGRGHNPEVFRLKDGRYVLYVIGKCYVAGTLAGPWKQNKFKFDLRGHKKIAGNSNMTFTRREDGSFLMICRGGGIWISADGYPSYNRISNGSVYPKVKGDFEDPVVWRDHVQYHLIVNDWRGRIAYYMRSKDGLYWVVDPGEAYVPGIAVHEDGKREDWFKYERIKILQDEYGRAVQANFAVIDILKENDKGGDNHSSKNLAIPLNPGMLLTMLETQPITDKTQTIQVKIAAEKNFNPQTDIDIESLHFGASTEVNWGRGCKVLDTKKDGKDLIVTFSAEGHGITSSEFAPKMIGRDTKGKLLYGYVRLPWVNYINPMMSVRLPSVVSSASGTELTFTVDNFGQVTSKPGRLTMFVRAKKTGKQEVGTVDFPALQPYCSATVKLSSAYTFKKGEAYFYDIEVCTVDGLKSVSSFSKVVPIR